MIFTIILPVFNGELFLKKNVPRLVKFLTNEFHHNFYVIIAEDGSTDNSFEIAQHLSRKFTNVKLSHSEKRLGRGKAIERGIKLVKGNVVLYMDIDFSTNPSHIKDVLEVFSKEHVDIVIGSRHNITRSTKRFMLSFFYNLLVRLLFHTGIKDHQCGFKAYRVDVLKNITKYTRSSHWFWDTETLVIAKFMNYKIREIPVKWKENKKSTVKIFKDSLMMFYNLIKLWYRIHINNENSLWRKNHSSLKT